MPHAARAPLLLAMLVFFIGCGRTEPASDAPEHAGGTATNPRIVVLSPALGVILTEYGLADCVVGRHGWDTALDQDIPVCGDQNALNYESLIRAEPTHVLLEWGERELPERLTSLAERRGWVVRNYRLMTLDEIADATRGLGELFPGAEPGATIERFLTLVGTTTPEPVWDGRVLLLMGTSPISALGPGSSHHELLVSAGGRPAITEGSPFMPLHAEDVLRLAPDAICIIKTDADAGPDMPLGRVELGAIGGLDIPAVRNDRVVVINHPQAVLPSPRLVEVRAEMERAIRGWAED